MWDSAPADTHHGTDRLPCTSVSLSWDRWRHKRLPRFLLKGDLKKKTFFIDSPKEEGEQLVFLSFGKEKVVVNMGVLDGDKVRISRKPMPIKFNTLYSEEETEYKEFRYTPNLQRPISIIDPETTEELKPVLYLDKATNEVKGKCKLKPYKSYFAFEVRDMKDD